MGKKTLSNDTFSSVSAKLKRVFPFIQLLGWGFVLVSRMEFTVQILSEEILQCQKSGLSWVIWPQFLFCFTNALQILCTGELLSLVN